MTLAWLVPLAGILSYGLTYVILRIVTARRIEAAPTERGMNKDPVAVGAGWAIVATVLVLWPVVGSRPPSGIAVIVFAMLMLAVMSWLDDVRTLPPLGRLIVQMCVVGICMAQLPPDGLVFGGLFPSAMDRFVTGLGWLWFINLYNFMDGIDGIAGSETIAIAMGYIVIALLPGQSSLLMALALILAGASAGFLVWNWHPARIILGDVGSIPLGFLLGWLMLDLAMRGHLAAALILPMHHIADATGTLVRRCMTVGEPWKPHRDHVYQKAVLSGFSVPEVVVRIAALNVVLIGLAVLSLSWPWTSLVLAGIATGLTLRHLGSRISPAAPINAPSA